MPPPPLCAWHPSTRRKARPRPSRPTEQSAPSSIPARTPRAIRRRNRACLLKPPSQPMAAYPARGLEQSAIATAPTYSALRASRRRNPWSHTSRAARGIHRHNRARLPHNSSAPKPRLPVRMPRASHCRERTLLFRDSNGDSAQSVDCIWRMFGRRSILLPVHASSKPPSRSLPPPLRFQWR